MKIAVNTRLLRKNQMDGIGWFAYNTLKNIVKQNPQIEFHFLFDSGIEKEFLFSENIVPHNLFPPAKHALLNIAWFEYSVKRHLKKIRPDLFFSPDGMLCLGWSGKQHGVIHDINFKHHPEYLKYSNRKYYNYFVPKFIKKATGLATVSEYSKKDICNTYRVDEKLIDVVYCGINSFFKPVPATRQEAIRKKYTDEQAYFVFVGALSPRKNILGLMDAFESFKKKTGNDTKLVIVGAGLYKSKNFYQHKTGLKSGSDIHFVGRLNEEDLNDVVGSALAMVFVPFFEGFGIPLVEAMKCEVPVIASNVTSLPEIAGNAALFVDPYSIDSIVNAMIDIQQKKELRNELINNGRTRKELFSWERTSDLLWKSIQKCL